MRLIVILSTDFSDVLHQLKRFVERAKIYACKDMILNKRRKVVLRLSRCVFKKWRLLASFIFRNKNGNQITIINMDKVYNCRPVKA